MNYARAPYHQQRLGSGNWSGSRTEKLLDAVFLHGTFIQANFLNEADGTGRWNLCAVSKSIELAEVEIAPRLLVLNLY